MASYELDPIPLSVILAEVKELISKGYDPLHYLGQFKVNDEGGYLKKF